MSDIILQTELVELLGKIEVLVLKVSHDEVEYLLDKKEEHIQSMETNLGMLRGALPVVERLIPLCAVDTSEEQTDLRILNEVRSAIDSYQTELSIVIKDELAIAQDMRQMSADRDSVETIANALVHRGELKTAAARSEAQRVSIILMVLAVVVGGILTFSIVRGITAALSRCVRLGESMADGDFTQAVDANRADEIGVLIKAMNAMRETLHDAFSGIQQASGQVASSSEELSSSSQSLSSGASEQAANLEETSASIEELNASIQSNSELAQSGKDIAAKSAARAEEGGQAVRETVAAMKQIADQIAIIDDIADQTNLLALNAAIEAARAGEMGKGFAVVAVEVRKLAERSQKAAKEISELAGTSVVGAERAGDLIEHVVPDIQRTAQIADEMYAATTEQASGAEQINLAVTQLDQVTQQNASTSEETAAASEELAAQAQSMQELISRFRISANGYERSLSGLETATRPRSLQSAHVGTVVPQLPAPERRPKPERKRGIGIFASSTNRAVNA